MQFLTRTRMAVIVAILAGIGTDAMAQNAAITAKPADPAPVILISIDGFRPDYLDRGFSPTLSALADHGVRAQRMVPSYPSVTFPNHTALVTGLYPDHNGIIANSFTDPAMPASFTMGSKEPGWWMQSTPIWVSAEQAGVHTGVMFWPGVSVPHNGVRASLWHDYDHAMLPADRVDTVLGWMDLPAARRPRLSLLYFEAVDHAGHVFGPMSPEVDSAIATTDQAIGRLIAGLKVRGIAANLIIVADHGMAAVGDDHVLMLDDVIDTRSVRVAFDGTVVGIAIQGTAAGAVARQKLLEKHPHMQCWDKANVPARLHYGRNLRVPDVICMVQTGWLVVERNGYERAQMNHPGHEKGAHGYDNGDPAMGALFIAAGPAFRKGVVTPPFPNVDVYPLIARLLGIAPLPNDGHLADLAGALKP